MEPVIIAIWVIGAVVATAAPITFFLIDRSKWRKLPSLDVETKGPGPSPEEQEEAIAFFVTNWPEAFNVNGLRIEWRRGEWFWVGKQKAAGKTTNKDNIVCAKDGGIRALFHELTHVYFWREDGTPDYHHFNGLLWDKMYDIQLLWEQRAIPLNLSRWSATK